MTLLPIAGPTTPPNGAAAPDVTSASGDFAALLALLAGIVMPSDVPVDGPEVPVPTPPPPVEATPVPVEAAPAVAPLAAHHPQVGEAMPAPAAPTTQLPRVTAAQQQVRPEAPPTPPAEVMPAPPVEALHRPPASPVAVEASPALTETSPAPTPAPDASGSREAEAPPIVAESPLIPGHPVQEDPPEHRTWEKPVPEITGPVPAPWPAAGIRAEAPVPADAPAATPVAPPAVPEQIVSAVVPLHGRGDGRHEMTLELRPEDLGTIRVEVSVEHQTVHLTLHAAEPATGRLLSAGLADLRSALADAGLNAGHIAVSPDGGTGTGRRSRPQAPVRRPHPSQLAGHAPRTAAIATVLPATLATAGQLDLFL